MRRVVFPLVLLAGVAGAAPVPRPDARAQIEAVWGKPFARSEKYEFKLDGRNLTIRTAGEAILRPFPKKPPVIPRTHRPVSGDFVATVRVVAAAAPDPKANYEEGAPASRAGILVTGGGWEVNLFLFQHHTLDTNRRPNEDPVREVFGYVWNEGHGRGRPYGPVDLKKPLYFRIARKEQVVTAAHGTDGTTWVDAVLSVKPDFPDEVTVGVFFAHTTHQVADATFSDFAVEKPPKPK